MRSLGKVLVGEAEQESGFFSSWPKDLGVPKPSPEQFGKNASRLGTVRTVPNGEIEATFNNDFKRPGHTDADNQTHYYLAGREEARMPVAFLARGDYWILLAGRHRIGWALDRGSDVQVLVLPYPGEGQEIYSESRAEALLNRIRGC